MDLVLKVALPVELVGLVDDADINSVTVRIILATNLDDEIRRSGRADPKDLLPIGRDDDIRRRIEGRPADPVGSQRLNFSSTVDSVESVSELIEAVTDNSASTKEVRIDALDVDLFDPLEEGNLFQPGELASKLLPLSITDALHGFLLASPGGEDTCVDFPSSPWPVDTFGKSSPTQAGK